jgi:hypothetical protein
VKCNEGLVDIFILLLPVGYFGLTFLVLFLKCFGFIFEIVTILKKHVECCSKTSRLIVWYVFDHCCVP